MIAPEGSILNARSPAAVVAGNVETSSRVADLVLAAFGRALGQGTMNNVVLGTEDFTYYETLGGGQGACPDADGPSGVHVAMSNTLNTPVEARRARVPAAGGRVRVRRDSGGAGRHRGGDGVVREYEMLEDMELSLLTERRRHAPPGRRRRRAGREAGATCSTARSCRRRRRRSLAKGAAPAHRDARRRRARRAVSFPSQPPALAGVVHQDVRVDGCRWHVATAGDPEAPPVVLLHGWPQHWWVWRKVIPALAREHRVYAPDLRGFGWSDAPPGPYAKEGLAADVVRLLDALGDRALRRWPATTGAASSPGWPPCRRPERVERLVALSIIHPWFVPERNLKAITSTLYQVPIMTPGVNRVFPPFGLKLMRRIAAPGWSDEDVRLYAGQYRRAAHADAAKHLYRTFLTRELTPIARGRYGDRWVTMPVTLATGSEDPVVTPARLEGAQAGDLRVEVLEGAGHFLPEFNARETIDLILHR